MLKILSASAPIWLIGESIDLGSNTGYIHSIQDSACPTSNILFKYATGGEFVSEPINSVSIQCV